MTAEHEMRRHNRLQIRGYLARVLNVDGGLPCFFATFLSMQFRILGYLLLVQCISFMQGRIMVPPGPET